MSRKRLKQLTWTEDMEEIWKSTYDQATLSPTIQANRQIIRKKGGVYKDRLKYLAHQISKRLPKELKPYHPLKYAYYVERNSTKEMVDKWMQKYKRDKEEKEQVKDFLRSKTKKMMVTISNMFHVGDRVALIENNPRLYIPHTITGKGTRVNGEPYYSVSAFLRSNYLWGTHRVVHGCLVKVPQSIAEDRLFLPPKFNAKEWLYFRLSLVAMIVQLRRKKLYGLENTSILRLLVDYF